MAAMAAMAAMQETPELPLPLTETLLATALAELGQGWATALESCIACYLSKRMSCADLLAFARSARSYSRSLAGVFQAEDAEDADERVR